MKESEDESVWVHRGPEVERSWGGADLLLETVESNSIRQL